MAAPSVELLVAAHTDGIVPAVVVGFGGIWTEILDDVAVDPVAGRCSADRAGAALAARRALLTGARGSAGRRYRCRGAWLPGPGELLLEQHLELLELNPVFVGAPGDGAVAVDATARRGAERRNEQPPVLIETEG